MKLGEYLKQKREEHGWTQPEAAKKAEIEQSYLSKLETSKSYPQEEIFERLVKLYGIQTNKLNQIIESGEYEKLSEIKQMRKLFIQQQQAQITVVKSWLITGLVFLMIGGACLAITQIYSTAQQEYFYRSSGIILPGESLQVFEVINNVVDDKNAVMKQKKAEMTQRIDQDDIITSRYRGASYVEETTDGRRFYNLIRTKDASQQSAMNWFLVPGLMFLLGSLGCFYISRRWQK